MAGPGSARILGGRGVPSKMPPRGATCWIAVGCGRGGQTYAAGPCLSLRALLQKMAV
jgi:hypothetical protein